MRKLSILFIAVFFAVTAGAQIGVKLGANFAGLSSSTETDGSKMAIGFHGGIVYEKGILPLGLLKLRTEVQYSQQGFAVYDDNGVVVTDTRFSINYLKLPIMAKVKLGPIYVMAGPYFGYALNGSYTGSMKSALGTVDMDIDIYDNDNSPLLPYKKFDMGLDAGLGMQFGIPAIPFKIFIEGRAAIGLSNIYDTENDKFKAVVTLGGIKDTDYIKNLVFQVSVGVLLF